MKLYPNVVMSSSNLKNAVRLWNTLLCDATNWKYVK